MKTTTLSPNEMRFLAELDSRKDKSATCRSNPPDAAIQSLVDRGYCRLDRTLCGPLGVATGEVNVTLTEAGASALSPGAK